MIAHLARYDWPGNVRELRNVVRWLAITGRSCTLRDLEAHLGQHLRDSVPSAPRTSPEPPLGEPAKAVGSKRNLLRKPSEVDEEELLTTLKIHRWRLSAAAKALGYRVPIFIG